MAKKRTKAQTEKRQRRRQAAFSGTVGALAGGGAAALAGRGLRGRSRPGVVLGAAAAGGYFNARGGVRSVRRAQGYHVRSRKQRVASGNTARYQRRDSKGKFR